MVLLLRGANFGYNHDVFREMEEVEILNIKPQLYLPVQGNMSSYSIRTPVAPSCLESLTTFFM